MSGLLTAILSVVFYSFSYVFLHKGQVESDIEDNGLLAVLAIGFVTLGIGAEFLSHGSRVLFQVHTRQQIVGYGFAALSGVIGTLFGRLTVYASIKRLGATRGIVVGSAESLVTLILAVLILRESFHVNDAIGLILLSLGISLLIFERMIVQERSSVQQGVILGLAGALLQGSGHFVRKLGSTSAVVPIIAAALDLAVALGFYIIFLAFSGRLRRYFEQYTKSFNAYLAVAGFCSAAGVLLFFVSLQTVPVWKVALIIGAEPLFVTVISKALFRNLERLTLMTAVCTLFVTAGIMFLQL